MGGDETWILSPRRLLLISAKAREGSKTWGERERKSLINNGRVLSVHIYQRMLSYRRFSLHIFLYTKSSHGNIGIESDQFLVFFSFLFKNIF